MVRNRLMALMRKIMLTCEEASLLSTRKIIEGVGRRDNMSLRMHLAACKHCKKHYIQTRILFHSIRKSHLGGENGSPLHRMSPTEKSKLQRIISNKIQSN